MIFFYLLCCCLSLWYCCVSWVFAPAHTHMYIFPVGISFWFHAVIGCQTLLLLLRSQCFSLCAWHILTSATFPYLSVCVCVGVYVYKCIYICVFEALFAQIFPAMWLSYNFRWKSAAQQMIVMTTISHKLTPKLAKRTQAESRTRSILCDSIDGQTRRVGRQKAKQIDRQLETQM